MGTGYVGLVSGVALAEHGHQVVCLDVIPEKIETLNRGVSPIFEPGLDELLDRHVTAGTLKGSLDIETEIAASDITFICVGTPSRPDGSIDLAYIEQASASVGRALAKKAPDSYHTVVVKSTVVPLTTETVVGPAVTEASGRVPGKNLGLVMNPEFLKEGAAIEDAMNPDRIVIGAGDEHARKIMDELYSRFQCPVLHTDPRTAEYIKYASNAFLAVKISFANELANAAEAWGIDWQIVAEGMGLDSRISHKFLVPGVGFGGSCFPKDVRAIQAKANSDGHPSRVLAAALEVNEVQPARALELALEALAAATAPASSTALVEAAAPDPSATTADATGLKGCKVALLGLAFKPDTDDVRETRALPIAQALTAAGARVTAHDVEGTENFKALVREKLATDGKAGELPLRYTDDPEVALKDAEVAIVQVPWTIYRELPAVRWAELMSGPRAVIDCRRGLDSQAFEAAGLVYRAIGFGRPC